MQLYDIKDFFTSTHNVPEYSYICLLFAHKSQFLTSISIFSSLAEGKLDQGITEKLEEVEISCSEKGESLQKQDTPKTDEQESLSVKEPVGKVYTHTNTHAVTNENHQRNNYN